MLILRSSLNARMSHYQRTLTWDLIQEPLRRVESSVLTASADMFSLPRTGPEQSHPASVLADLAAPLRHGGFGLHTTTKQIATAALLAGSAMAQVVMADGPAAFRPFDGPAAPALRQQWANLFNDFHTACSWPAQAKELRGCDVAVLLPQVQNQVARAHADKLWAAASTRSASQDDKRASSRLRSSAGAPSAGWLTAFPVEPTALNNAQFRNAGRHRLGVGAPQHRTPPPCTCGDGLADRPDHAMVCRHCNKQNQMRHDLLAYAVRRTACRAACSTSMEQHYHSLADDAAEAQEAGLTRTDVSILAPDGRIWLVDTMVTHQHMGCQLDTCHKSTGKAAHLGEQTKTRKFRLRQDHAQYQFVPFILESHGRLGKQAVAFLHEIAEWASSGGRISKNAFLKSAYRDISCALQIGNSAMYCKSAERLIRARGRHFLPGAAVPVELESML